MKINGSSRISIIRTYSFVVRYYDENGKKIGYNTASIKDLDEVKNRKIWLGKKIARVEVGEIR
tara:strand:- start:714 stop:902 length:189 start_codon:yes stop_codon:yes gene_type:complete